MNIDLQTACSTVDGLPIVSDFMPACQLLTRQFALADKTITLRITDTTESQALNHTYRQKDKPTNVLSFPAVPMAETDFVMPAEAAHLLGDLVLCHAVIEAEATAQNKPLLAHYIHLFIHGMLHLLGYDHQTDTEADEMESLEITLLEQLNIPNPYKDQTNGT